MQPTGFQSSDNPRELIRLGNLLGEKCALDEARATFRRAFAAAKSKGDVRSTAEALAKLLRMGSEARDTAEIAQCERELKALLASHPTQIPAIVWYCQAVLAGQREHWRLAQSHLRQYLRALEHSADPGQGQDRISGTVAEETARAWVMLANTFTQRGQLKRAEWLLNWAITQFEAQELPGINGMIYLQLGWMGLRRRDADAAAPWIEKAQAAFLAEANWYLHLYVLYAYACMARVRGDYPKANWYLDHLEKAARGPAFAFFREQLEVERRRLKQDSVDLSVDGRRLQVRTREKTGISLGKQYVLLHILEALSEAHHRDGSDSDRALSKAELIEKVWGEKYRPHLHDNKLYYNINRLRKLIEPDMKEPQYLLNWKEGYRLAPGLRVQLQGANNPLKRKTEKADLKGLKGETMTKFNPARHLATAMLAASVFASNPALASQGPPPASTGNQPVGGCYSTCGGDVPWPLEVSNQQVELADGGRYLLIGTIEINAGRAYFSVDLAKQPWLSNPKRRQNPRYPLTGNVEYWEAYVGKRVCVAGMAQWSVVREVENRQYRVDVVLRSLADPAVLLPGTPESGETSGGGQGVSDSSGHRATLWDQFDER